MTNNLQNYTLMIYKVMVLRLQNKIVYNEIGKIGILGNI